MSGGRGDLSLAEEGQPHQLSRGLRPLSLFLLGLLSPSWLMDEKEQSVNPAPKGTQLCNQKGLRLPLGEYWN